MTVAPLVLAWILLFPLLAGVAVIRGLGVRLRDDRIAFLGWAWLAGTLLLTILLFAWSWFGLPAPRAGATALVALVALCGEVAARRRRDPDSAPARSGAHPLEQVLFGATLLLAFAITFDRMLVANATIVCVGDESVIWAAKAKALWFGHGMTDDFRRILGEQRVLHGDYPPQNPLLQWWTWLNAGHVADVENRLPIQGFVPAMLLIAASALRRRVRPSIAAALLLLLVASQGTLNATWSADSDGIVAFGLLVAVDAWLRFHDSGQSRFFALTAMGLATALWAKNEGALFAAIFGVALIVAALTSRATRARLASLGTAGAWLLVPIGCELGHRAFNLRFGLTNDLAGDSSGSFLTHLVARLDAGSLRTLATWFSKALLVPATLAGHFSAPGPAWLGPADQNLLLPAFLVMSLAAPRRAFCGGLGVATIALMLSVAGVAVVYLGTVNDLAWHLETSVGRVLFDLAPAAAIVLAELIGATNSRQPGSDH